MVEITNGQSLIRHQDTIVVSPTGVYNDMDVILIANINTPEITIEVPACMIK